MFRTSLMIAGACLFLGAWPDQAQAQRWRGGRGYIGRPYASVGYGSYYGNNWYGNNWYGYNHYPYYTSNWGYGYNSPYNYNRGWYGYPSIGVYAGTPVYSSGYATGPTYYSGNSAYQSQIGTTTSFYNGPPAQDTQVRVRVVLPDPNAQLMVQDQMNQATGTERFIISPALTVGTNYHYTFRATWRDANGQDITREKKIDVVPGQQYTVDFNQN